MQHILSKLAAMEDDHENLFSSLQENLPEKAAPFPACDPDGDVAHYQRASADTHVSKLYPQNPDTMADAAGFEDVLQTPIQFEKGSVCFFLGLRDMVPAEPGRGEVDRLIREEMGHITLLNRTMETAAGK